MLKILFKQLLSVLGFQWSRIKYLESKVLDYTNKCSGNVLELIYQGGRNSIVVGLDLKDCRYFGFHGFKLEPGAKSPFVVASNPSLLDDAELRTNILKQFYNEFTPDTINDYIGFNLSNSCYGNMPPSYAVFPWTRNDPKDISLLLYKHELAEASQYGFVLTESDGYKYFGPVSRGKLDLEAERINKVVRSIYEKGYLLEDLSHTVHATVLVKDCRTRFLINGGQHRVAAAAALGMKKIPVRLSIENIVRYKELKFMSAVVKGYYTVEEAEKIFNKIFNGCSYGMALSNAN